MSSARTTGSWMMILLSLLALAALSWFSVNRQFEGGFRDAVAAMINPDLDMRTSVFGSPVQEPEPDRGSGVIPKSRASLLLKLAKSRADVSAELPQGTEQAKVWELLSDHYQNGQLSYKLALHDATDHDPAWIARLPVLLETLLKDNERPDLQMLITKDKAEFSGAVDSQEKKSETVAALNALFDDGRKVTGTLGIRDLPTLTAKLKGGALELGGKLPDSYKVRNYANQLKKAYKASSVDDRVVYDDKVADLKLLSRLPDASAYMAEQTDSRGFTLIDGKLEITIESENPEIDDKINKKLTSLVPDTVFGFNIVAPEKQSQEVAASEEKKAENTEPRSELLAVNFGYNSVELTPESFEALDQLFTRLQIDPKLRIIIEGHTDNAGDPASNRYLSTRRALSVRQHLVDAGIEEARLKVVGFGDAQPIASNDTREGRYKNRRIEIREDKAS